MRPISTLMDISFVSLHHRRSHLHTPFPKRISELTHLIWSLHCQYWACNAYLNSLKILFWPLLKCIWASLVAQMVKKPFAMQETGVPSLGWEDPLEKGMTTHFSILAWKIPWKVHLKPQWFLSLFFPLYHTVSLLALNCSPFVSLLSPSCLTYELGTQISSVLTSLVSQLHSFLLPSE